MRYRIQADPKLPIARFNGRLCTIVKMQHGSDYPYRVRLVDGGEGNRSLMCKITELRPE